MAIITPGPTVAAISGSIGGTVYSRNRGGAYIRNRAIPVDPNTSFQINVRAILAAQSQNWADLTDAQRAAFENWALQNLVTNALGNQIRLSGHQAFVQLNSRLALGGFATLTAPPILNAPLGLTSIALTADVGLGAVEVAFALTPLAAGISLWVLAAVVNSPGISYVRNLFKQVQITGGGIVSPQDIQVDVEARFGALIVGQTLHVKVSTFQATTGLMSVPFEDSAVVVTT